MIRNTVFENLLNYFLGGGGVFMWNLRFGTLIKSFGGLD